MARERNDRGSGGRLGDFDLVLRENMFGGGFGGLCSQGGHFFDEQGHLYRAFASLTELRKQLITLRRGSQVLHRISGDGVNFGLPQRIGDDRIRSLVCWSRLFLDQETLVAINTDQSQSLAAWSTVAPLMCVDGDEFHLIFWHAPQLLGGVSYQSWGKQPLDPPMFTVINSEALFSFGFYHYNAPFNTIVMETVGNETRTLLRKDLHDYHLPLYRAWGADLAINRPGGGKP